MYGHWCRASDYNGVYNGNTTHTLHYNSQYTAVALLIKGWHTLMFDML